MIPSRPRSLASDALPLAPEQLAELPAIVVQGDAAALPAEMLQEAAAAVLHYLRHDLGRTSVSLVEFAGALQTALRGLGLDVEVIPADGPCADETDLQALWAEAPDGLELVFFERLRAALQRQLMGAEGVARFSGLRACVKRMLGARRWSRRCQALGDQIIEYLRACLKADRTGETCALVVR